MGSDELLRNVGSRHKVARRIEWKRSLLGSAISIMATAIDTADGEEGPSRGIPGVGDASGRGLEEVKLIFGAALRCTGQNGQEL